MTGYFKFMSLAALSLMLITEGLQAQNGKTLTLNECIEIALKNNSDFKTASYQVNRAGADVTGSYSTILPRITSSFSANRSTIGESANLLNIPQTDIVTVPDINGQEIDIAVQRLDASGQPVVQRVQSTSPSQSFNNHSMTIRYDQTLFDFGRSFNTIKQAKASFNAASESLTSARQSVYSTVKQRYLELLKAIKLEQEFQLAVQRSKEQLERTKSMYEIGSVAQIDVYRQEVTLGTDEINLINQQNTVEIAKGNLNIAMGADPETEINIADVEVTSENPAFTLNEAVEIAEQNNPDLRRFQHDMKSAEYGRKAAKGRYLPSLGVSALYNRDNEQFNRVYGEFDKNFFFQIGASVDFNIFNGLSDKAEVSRQTSNHSIAKESWLNRKRTLRLEVKQAYINLKAFKDIAEINERNLRAAEEDFRLAQERYRVGAGTSLEVTESQVSLTRARVNLVRTQYDAIIAQARLQAAMGTISDDNSNN